MNYIEPLFKIDFKAVILGVLVALIAFQFLVKLCQWLFFEFLGIETKSMRKRREEHELLINTANELKNLSDKHQIDVKKSIEHDEKIENELRRYVQEIQKSVLENVDTIKQYAENRIHDREQSRTIQKELTDSIKQLADANASRDEKIENIIISQKETLADRINQKYKHYLSIGGIPEDEVDEFISLHSSYNLCGGNHFGDAKFKYCIDHLPIIPVDVKLKFDESKSENK